ncbi:MAG: hypothetical protein WCT01_04490 [Candidatus Shapirobacteria bacterium]
MKKLFVLILAGLIMGGCGGTAVNSGQVTKEGTIKAKIGNEYVMMVGEETINVTSEKINLDQYLKKPIEVKGMYSGSTLYVDEVREK